MALIVKQYVVTKTNRDQGKKFVLTEMAPRKAHAWATKAIFGMLAGGMDIPDDIAAMGLAGLAVIGIGGIAKIPHAVAAPMLDELFDCVQIVQDLITRPLVDEDIEEVTTLFDLQAQVMSLHIDPFLSGGNRTSASQPTTPAAAA